jgi:AAA+ ATPase superfamily predicted ATPase
MKMINRVSEKKYLEKKRGSDKAELIIIYGRRRVGKTFLLSNVLQNSLFLTADLSTPVNLMNTFLNEIKSSIGLPKNIRISEWDDFFSFLLHYVKRQNTKPVIVIDEFQYISLNDKSFLSILQKWWDREFKNLNLMVVLCGSYAGMIEKIALSQNSPLYGRRTGQYKIEPMDFYDSSLFLKDTLLTEKIKIFSATGGIPIYLKEFSDYASFEEGAIEKCLSPGEFLVEEGAFITMEEFSRDASLYFDILRVVASGRTTPNEIATLTGINYNGLGTYLRKLIDLNLLKKERPFSIRTPRKKSLYSIGDHYLRFYFKYISPNKELIYRESAALLMEKINETFSEFCSYTFEEVCKDHLWRSLKPDTMGRWWDKDKEIDIVAVKDRVLHICECKWTSKKVDFRVLNKLKLKTDALLKDLKTEFKEIHYHLFSKSGFENFNKEKNVELVSFEGR